MMEAVIVGSGVLGLSTAYHLAKRRFGRVIVLEKGPIGDGSSSRAAGIITELLWTETGVRARKKSLQLFRELSQELDGYQFQRTGALNLFDSASWLEQRPLIPLYERLQAPFEIIGAEEIHRRWPALFPREDYIGLFDPEGGYSEPDEYIPALAQRCKELGVEIREWCMVDEFVREGGRITGVRTSEGLIRADAVICTVYAWTAQLMQSVGERLPVKCFVHQRYLTQPFVTSVDVPAVNAHPLGGYIRPASGNRLLCGVETSDRLEFQVPTLDFRLSSLTVNPELTATLRQNLSGLLPAVKGSIWETERVGLLTFSSDGEPILGPVEKLPGLYVAVAFHSGGFAYNPVAGMLLAEFVAEGRTSIDVGAFSLSRFQPEDVDEFLASTIAQKDVEQRRH